MKPGQAGLNRTEQDVWREGGLAGELIRSSELKPPDSNIPSSSAFEILRLRISRIKVIKGTAYFPLSGPNDKWVEWEKEKEEDTMIWQVYLASVSN